MADYDINPTQHGDLLLEINRDGLNFTAVFEAYRTRNNGKTFELVLFDDEAIIELERDMSTLIYNTQAQKTMINLPEDVSEELEEKAKERLREDTRNY